MNTVNDRINTIETSSEISTAGQDERSARPHPTIRDVARVAGVSYQTVSRVVKEVDGVKPTTRARVRDAIESTGWTPNEAASDLARKRRPALDA